MQSLLGRERELRKLEDLIDHVNDQGVALVVRGEAGVGKSALLAAASAQAQANGLRVLAITGVQSETHLPFAGLHQLLRPLLSNAQELSEPQRDALLSAFGVITAPAPDFFFIALAALELLALAAEQKPLLIIAEDVHWLDDSSRDVLAFVARRLESDPVILLMTIRDGYEHVLGAVALPEMQLVGLDDHAAGALLDLHAPELDTKVRARLLREAVGNPLALLELPRALSNEQREGRTLLPERLPLTLRLEHAFGAQIAHFPEATRALLLVAGINDSGALAETLTAAALLDGAATLTAFDPAVEAQLIAIEGPLLKFCHPLVRSAAGQLASVTQRRAAHAALAEALSVDPDRSVWHRAASLTGPDETVAAELEVAATRAQDRGAHAVAVVALERAARLSATPAQQGNRLLRAAVVAFELGHHDQGMRLLGQIGSLPLEAKDRTQYTWLIEVFADEHIWTGAAKIASFVALAEEARRRGDADLALSTLHMIALRCWWSNPDTATRRLVLEAAERLPVPPDHPLLLLVLAFAVPVECGAIVTERIARQPADVTDHPEAAYLLGLAASAVSDFEQSARLLSIGIAGVRAQGRLGILAQLLVAQAAATLFLGTWNVALPAAAEASRLARETGQVRWAAAAQLLEATAAALRGDQSSTDTLVTEAEQMLSSMGSSPMLALAQYAHGVAALSAGRYASAYDHLHRIFDPADSAYHLYVRAWAFTDLVESATHSGHQNDVRSLMMEMESIASTARWPYLLVSLDYARALLAGDETAENHFLDGLEATATGWPFLHARQLLAYGTWLRRRRRITDARIPLRQAREAFDALGAIPWGERARQELRAAGEASPQPTPVPANQLSPQELQIVQMAAEGLSNREIGQRLYLSHRTVGSHLYRIFPKLGITARSELRAALQG
jgi:DNA-binding CsgD family transcriptional regulator